MAFLVVVGLVLFRAPRALAWDDDDSDPDPGHACLSADFVNSPGCYKNQSDAVLLPLIQGTAGHPLPFPKVCGRTVTTPAEARAVLGTGGSNPSNKLKRDALTTIFNIRRSILSGNGRLGEDGPACFGLSPFRIVLRCGGFFIPNASTPDPNDAEVITEHTPLQSIVDLASQLCEMASCPPTQNSPCGKTLNYIASVLNKVNAAPSREGPCGGACSGDRSPPTLTCPTGTLELECQGQSGAAIVYEVKATDNCDPNPRVTCFPPPGTVLPLGACRDVECTATDGSCNKTTCKFKVKIVDHTPPKICCPGPVVVDCAPGGGSGAVVHYPDPTAFDRCDEHPYVRCAPPSGSFFPFGLTRVTCTAEDDSGNISTCSFDVEVVEAASPHLICPGDITTECTGPDGAVVLYPPPTVSETCDPPGAPTSSPPSGSVFPIGVTTVSCSTVDGHGNRIECQFKVTVEDTHPPAISCPQDMVVECASSGATAVNFNVTAWDACDPHPDVTCSPPPGSLFPIGMTEVHCTATDHAGNKSWCAFKITVRDTQPPQITCPQGPIRAACAIMTPSPGANVNFPAPVAADSCDDSPAVVCNHPSGSFFPLGTTTVTCTATDDAGNSSSCSFDVEVVDKTPPMLVCIQDVQVECSGQDGAIVNYPPPVVADDCDVAPTVTCSPPPGSLFSVGMTEVHSTATDQAGNKSWCAFKVTVTDSIPPSILCPGDKIVECESPQGAKVDFSVVATDSCDPAPAVECNPPSGSVFPHGMTVVECTALDSFGNESRCQFKVSVVDTRPPEIHCPEDIVAECSSTGGTTVNFAVSAEDACDPHPDVSCQPPPGSVFPVGTTEVHCTATDDSGNSSWCSFRVTVQDTTPPRITCPVDAILIECAGDNSAPANYPAPVASDLCDSSPEVLCDPPAGTILSLGTHPITCTATDDAGNKASCSFEVKIVDTAPPALTCMDDITTECQSPEGSSVSYPPPVPTDRCDPAPNLSCLPASGSLFPIGQSTVMCTADDDAGNMVKCEFKINVVDTHPPAIQCSSDLVVECASPGGALVSYTVTATDDCDPHPVVTCDPPSGQLFPMGQTTVSCAAVDKAGNKSACSFTVTVRDTAPPTITCPADFETDCNDVVYPPPQATDPCDPSPAVSCTPPSGSHLPLGVNLITCKAKDASGNEASCQFKITVVDRTPPALVCPPDQAVECASPNGTRVEYPTPTSSDACDPQPAVACVPPSGSVFPLGQTEVVCTAKDQSGNTMECSFFVLVKDTLPPDLACPNPIVAECTSPGGADVTFATTATDKCDPAPQVSCDLVSGSTFPIGQTAVKCQATDASGNKSECTFTITVVDRTPPVISCPADITATGTTAGGTPHKPPGWPPGSHPPANAITATMEYAPPPATDLCQTGPIQVTCNPPSGSRFELGEHTVTCKARDQAGNEATCELKVKVILGPERAFIRGDANSDSLIDIGDPVWIINFLFVGSLPPKCMDAADANDDERVDISDSMFTLQYNFMGGPHPPPPAPPLCGLDPAGNQIGCARYPPCE
jgi:hypothetical protein